MSRLLSLLVSALAGALIAALVVVAVPAEGAPNGGGPGDPLLLSRVNQAGPMTVLKTNGGFRILAKNPKRPPLMIYTPDGMPPLEVSSKAKVENLNADLVDGLNASAFVRASQLVLPVAAYAGGNQTVTVGRTSKVVRSVSLTPPAPGLVIVNATANVQETVTGDETACSITTGVSTDSSYLLWWESSGGNNETAQLAGTRGFPVTGSTPFTANLVCAHDGIAATSNVRDSALTAIFIPNG
jgi:hypothetical protein